MFYNAFNEIANKKEEYHFSGKSNILKQPEFDDASKMRLCVVELHLALHELDLLLLIARIKLVRYMRERCQQS